VTKAAGSADLLINEFKNRPSFVLGFPFVLKLLQSAQLPACSMQRSTLGEPTAYALQQSTLLEHQEEKLSSSQTAFQQAPSFSVPSLVPHRSCCISAVE
jgi:hypothetical protein